MCVSGAEDIPAALAAAEAAMGDREQAVKDFAKVDFYFFFSFFLNSAPFHPCARRSKLSRILPKYIFFLTQRHIIHGQYGATG